jgi:hypothetical protein
VSALRQALGSSSPSGRLWATTAPGGAAGAEHAAGEGAGEQRASSAEQAVHASREAGDAWTCGPGGGA